MMTKNTVYRLWAAVGLLFLLNVGSIGWIVVRQQTVGTPAAVQPSMALAGRLGFTSRQRDNYRQQQIDLLTRLRPHEDSLHRLRIVLFGQAGRLSDPQINDLVTRMEHEQGAMLRLRLSHWQRIRAGLQPAQQVRFDTLIARLGQRFGQPHARRLRSGERRLNLADEQPD